MLALSLLLAASASSPFLEGHDTRLHSARTQTFTKSFPRCGVPDVFGSWQAWADYVELLVRTRSIVEFTQLWWSVRPHHDFGTVEVRICDAQTTAQEADQLAALITACVRRAAEEVDAGETPPDLPGRLIEENMWRAIRYGQDGHLLDLEAHIPTLAAWKAEGRPPFDKGAPLPTLTSIVPFLTKAVFDDALFPPTGQPDLGLLGVPLRLQLLERVA